MKVAYDNFYNIRRRYDDDVRLLDVIQCGCQWSQFIRQLTYFLYLLTYLLTTLSHISANFILTCSRPHQTGDAHS